MGVPRVSNTFPSSKRLTGDGSWETAPDWLATVLNLFPQLSGIKKFIARLDNCPMAWTILILMLNFGRTSEMNLRRSVSLSDCEAQSVRDTLVLPMCALRSTRGLSRDPRCTQRFR